MYTARLNIDPAKLGKILADNGSNMIKAFKDVQLVILNPDEE